MKYNFDQPLSSQPNNFVKNNSDFLQQMFGTADMSPLFIADMDFKIAEEISDAYRSVADRGVFSYEFPPQTLGTSLVNWYQKRHQLPLIEDNFQLIHGVLTAIAALIQEFSRKGDKVVIQTPVYHQFSKAIEMNHRQVIENPMQYSEGKYTMDFEHLDQLFKREKPALFILCNPHNPVGRVWTRKELSTLVDLCQQHQVLIISDEIHADILFEGHTFTSLSQWQEEQIIVLLGSPAKTFGMQGSAAGFIYCQQEEIQQRIKEKIESMYLNHVPSIVMYAIDAAYQHGEVWLDELLQYLHHSREQIMDYVSSEMPGVHVVKPEGTYQIWLDFSALNYSREALDALFFQEAKVGLAPGHWFGEHGVGFARLNYASPLSYILGEMKKIANKLPHKK